MFKLFERIFWHNDTTPALNETNLNLMSKAISDIDDRVIELGSEVLEVVPQIQIYLEQAEDLVEAMETLTTHPPYIGENGDWYVWNTETGAYIDSQIDASITVDIADVTMISYGSTPYITNTGTDTDPVFHLYIPRAANISSIIKTGTSGLADTYTITTQDGYQAPFTVTNGRSIVSITKTGTAGLVDTYTITYNDNTTSTFTVTNGQNGSGSGDMSKTVYDPDSAVENAGGIKAWFNSVISNVLTWANIDSKPFSAIGSGLSVNYTGNPDGNLTADVQSVEVTTYGTASASTTKSKVVEINGAGGTDYVLEEYMQQTITTSTSADVTATFTNQSITTDSDIEVKFDKWGMVPSNVVTTAGQCVVTIPKQDTAYSLGVKIIIK